MSKSILKGRLKDPATWWSVSPNGSGGDLFGTPVLIDTRWEDRQETFIGLLDKRELISNAVVFTDQQSIAVGDYLCRGDQTTQADPTSLSGAFKVQRFDKIPDLRSLDSVQRAVL